MIEKFAHMLMAAANDAKTIHLYAQGDKFDRLHQIAGDIYDTLSEDADLFAEIEMEVGAPIVNPSVAAVACNWQPVDPVNYLYSMGIQALIQIYNALIQEAYQMNDLYPSDLGIQNALQDWIQRAQKELRYKLMRRL